MARKEINVEKLNALVPELPVGFEEWCKRNLPSIPIYYRRNNKGADCMCGKCAGEFQTNELPVRFKKAKCPDCGHIGWYEWKRVTHGEYAEDGAYLLQLTEDNNLVLRIFRITQWYQQYKSAKIEVTEYERHFLTMGDAHRLNWEYKWGGEKGWMHFWGTGAHYQQIPDGEIYPGWEKWLEKSNLKYCKVTELAECAGYALSSGYSIKNVLIAYANNPAIEMYAKMGLRKVVSRLIYNSGRCGLINRRGKNVKQQLRLRDKLLINRLVEKEGDLDILEILQYEQKSGIWFTKEQEAWLKSNILNRRIGKKYMMHFLKYMTVRQLMNRIEKYSQEKDAYGTYSTIGRYYDYLVMREELGYDMTNEVYIYPKNLKQKHDQMVKEKDARKDELRESKKNKEFQNIAKRYKRLCEKYCYEADGYSIRPVKDAAEIIQEGRKQHHCVGSSDTYMKRHDKGESYILLLRRVDKPDKPYYTIEIKKNEVVQWYAAHDKKPDKEVIEKWLNDYMEHLKKSKKKSKLAESLPAAV